MDLTLHVVEQRLHRAMSWTWEGGAFSTLSIPEFSALREFVKFAGPGFFAPLGKVICYSSMTTAAAAAGTLSLAAHQLAQCQQARHFTAERGEGTEMTVTYVFPTRLHFTKCSDGVRRANLRPQLHSSPLPLETAPCSLLAAVLPIKTTTAFGCGTWARARSSNFLRAKGDCICVACARRGVEQLSYN